MTPRGAMATVSPARVEELNLERLQSVDVDLRVRWLSARSELVATPWWPASVLLLVTQGFRPAVEQGIDFAKGRTTPGPGASVERPLGDIVTRARPGDSPHQWRCALDVAFVDGGLVTWGPGDLSGRVSRLAPLTWADLWDRYGAACERQGLRWGGLFTFKDRPHVELRDWRERKYQAVRHGAPATGYA